MYHFIFKSFLILIIVCVVSSFIGDRHNTIQSKFNPTGTYRLDIKTKKRDGEIYGYFGEIRVKMIDDSNIAVSFYVCKGAPGYNSGSFLDTLRYINKQATYLPPEDSTCKLKFFFTSKGLTINQYQENLNFGCGFGHGVFADGYYRIVSKDIPLITDLMTEDMF